MQNNNFLNYLTTISDEDISKYIKNTLVDANRKIVNT